MATRLTDGPRVLEREKTVFAEDLPGVGGLVTVQHPAHVPRSPPPSALMGAMLAWMSVVFGVCYVVLPATAGALGLFTGVIESFMFNMPAFVLSSLIAVVAGVALRPKMRLDWSGPRDPVLSAASGSLLLWAIIHNSTPLLRPFASMGGAELVTFVGMNIVEALMIGMMLASFTKSRAAAFALGAGFQALLLGITLALFSL